MFASVKTRWAFCGTSTLLGFAALLSELCRHGSCIPTWFSGALSHSPIFRVLSRQFRPPKSSVISYVHAQWCPNLGVKLTAIVQDPSKNDIYTQHSGTVHVAKYSPSGFYVASADKFGKVRIWDTVNEEHILKNEFQPFSGPICDLAWTSDNQRIIVGGTGQAKQVLQFFF
ncbi:WD repeat-containing protein 1 [Fasciolopsis buskii]|uniref:WD repeat-containing protein 1 n=1 Tax=Fasciolopsis buskii TaxID=27845 RepID=A0A8E0RPL2_9TREM|nr:WD repeat-containing protein 1 [Fasciolopsis buski]